MNKYIKLKKKNLIKKKRPFVHLEMLVLGRVQQMAAFQHTRRKRAFFFRKLKDNVSASREPGTAKPRDNERGREVDKDTAWS